MATTYVIRGGEEGKRRLDLLAQVMGPTTDALLDRSGIAGGMTCADVGCGTGHVSRELAARVGPSGRVVGIDLDPLKVATAREEAEGAGLRNTEYRVADVKTWSDPGAYDLIYGRFIVSHLPDRQAFVGRLWESLRATGTLILEDIDFSGAFCYPPNPAFTRYCELYAEVVSRRGGDANVGPRLYQRCLCAGFRDLEIHVGGGSA
jgi:2-polyprenyl-3-methyl-5-hydroxy-6-metoxy-1,4-benzoquinol methylase